MRVKRNTILLTALATVWVLTLGAVEAGTIKGTVNFDGAPPKLRPLRMDADPGCAKKHSGPVAPEVLVLGEGQTLANIFVYVKSGVPDKSYPTPSDPVVMDQNGCQYKPHVMGVMVGQPFKVVNSDGLLHNVHSLPKINASFNRAMPAAVKEAEYTFTKEEFMFKIKCDVHPWMGAWVAVMTHPYFDVSSTDGSYTLTDLPPGTYEIEAWHEKLPAQTSTVTVGDGDETVNFTFRTPGK